MPTVNSSIMLKCNLQKSVVRKLTLLNNASVESSDVFCVIPGVHEVAGSRE